MTTPAGEPETSPSYSSFLSHYQDFRTHYNYCNQLRDRLQECLSLEAKTRLWQEAVQAHLKAAKAHQKAIQAYQEFKEQVWRENNINTQNVHQLSNYN